MGVFVLFYYKQVLGLSGTLTGLAIGISIIWDGISDPLVGAWSDRLRSRIGRRHPLMIAAVIPMAAGFVMLYGPPDNVLSDQGQLVCLAAHQHATGTHSSDLFYGALPSPGCRDNR